MKTLFFQIIDGYEIVVGISNPTIDPEDTRKKVDSILAENPDLAKTKTEEELYSEYAVFAHNVPYQKLVEDAAGEDFQTALAILNDHEKLLSSGEKIADWRNANFWKKDPTWKKETIKRLGETIPADGFLEEDLDETQRKEIAEEEEVRRIAGLTPEQKNKEKEALLNAAKREATLLKSDADIAGEQFDASAWFRGKKADIEEKYGS
jgi:hypothetical protein